MGNGKDVPMSYGARRVTKREIVDEVARSIGVRRAVVWAVLTRALEVIGDRLVGGYQIRLDALGVILVRWHKNVLGGYRARFRLCAGLRRRLRGIAKACGDECGKECGKEDAVN